MSTHDEIKRDNTQDSNSKQQNNEGFSGANIDADYNPAPLKTEQDIDMKGKQHTVERARNTSSDPNQKELKIEEPRSTNDNREIEEPKSVENRDRNSDVATNRYPASHPENHENRGNMKLDE